MRYSGEDRIKPGMDDPSITDGASVLDRACDRYGDEQAVPGSSVMDGERKKAVAGGSTYECRPDGSLIKKSSSTTLISVLYFSRWIKSLKS